MSKFILKMLPALVVVITATLLTQPMRAGVIDSLIITELSSTSLTASLNGNPLSVTLNFADNWSISLAGVSGTPQQWEEPDALGFVNVVELDPFAPPNQLQVLSDVGPAFFPLPDGTPDTTSFTLNGNPLSVTFFDKGDVTTAPDTGTTFSLLGVSLMGLGFLRRKLC
jgi:protein with PEP-CTERM/exosortase system signal